MKKCAQESLLEQVEGIAMMFLSCLEFMYMGPLAFLLGLYTFLVHEVSIIGGTCY